MSTRDVAFPARSRLRLQAYDYARSGAYFATVCTWERRCVLGTIVPPGKSDPHGSCPTLSVIIGSLKSAVTRQCNKEGLLSDRKLWQPRFHDHVVRGQNDYDRLWRYVDENPIKWNLDRYFAEGA